MIRRLLGFGRAIALVGVLSVVAVGQSGPVSWQDPSKHEVRFVTVEEGVRLEVLDWGGSGPAVVLLAGSGHTAHVYDDFAPKLTDCCHVYGITRRGYGASSRPSSGYDPQRRAADVLTALDHAKIQSPILVGHSRAGDEMTIVARQHSDRLAGLVYLDALGDLEDDPGLDKEWGELARQMPPNLRPSPVCGAVDTSTFAAYQKSLGCRLGFMLPESEMRQQHASDGGKVGAVTAPDWVNQAIGKQQEFRRDYSNIRVPVLALLERPRVPPEFKPRNEKERHLVEQFVARGDVMVTRWIDKLKRGAPDVRIADVPGGGHYLFLTREADVLRHVRAFIVHANTRKP